MSRCASSGLRSARARISGFAIIMLRINSGLRIIICTGDKEGSRR